MFAVLVLSLLAATASAEEGPTFEEVSDLLNVLELEKFELFDDLSTITTMCAVVGENIDILTEQFNPLIKITNEQQDEVIQAFSDQIKFLEHGADAAGAKIIEVMAIAKDTDRIVTEQLEDYLNGTKVAGVQEFQQQEIDMLRENLNNTQHEILNDTAEFLESIGTGATEFREAGPAIRAIRARTCEHGTGTFAPGEHDVLFQTNFTVPPVVTLQVVGFTSHLDVHSYQGHGYPKVDGLGLDKYVDYVNERGFGVLVEDVTEGSVVLKTVSCSWAACQNLDVVVPGDVPVDFPVDVVDVVEELPAK